MKLSIKILIIIIFIIQVPLYAQGESFTLLARWGEGITNAVAVEGDVAYIGNGSNLTLVDISSPEAPVEISSYLLTNIIQGIAVNGNYAYVVNGSLKLHILDISNPDNLTEVGSVALSSYNSMKIFYSNNFIYIVQYAVGLEIIDVNNPAAPVQTGIISVPSITDVFVEGDYAFIPAGASGMQIYDVSDPADPTLENVVDNGNNVNSIAADNNYAYLGGTESLMIYDISDIANPQELSSVGCTPDFLAMENGIVYAMGFYGNMTIINVDDPNNPAIVSQLPFGSFYWVSNLTVGGNNLFVVEKTKGLSILDVSDAANPIVKSLFRTASWINDLVTNDNLIFTADAMNGMFILNAGNKTNVTTIAKLIPESNGNEYYCLTVQDSYAYLGSLFGLYIIDISDPENPDIVKELATQRINKIEALGDYAYLVENGGGLVILDITDPLNPVETATLDGPITKFAAQNDKGYVVFSSDMNKLTVVDFSDAFNPEAVSDVEFDGISVLRDIFVSGNYVYAVGGNTMNIIDVSDAENPMIAGKYSEGGADWRSVFVSGEDAYLCYGENFTVINVGNPDDPSEAGRYSPPNTPVGYPAKLFVDGATVYLTQQEVGLLILENNYPTDVKQETVPAGYLLAQNYPNPFSKGTNGTTTTTIEYSVGDANFASPSVVSLKVYDILGKEVATLVNKAQSPGNYSVQFSAENLSSGIYFYKLNAGNFRDVKKMIILK